MWLTQKLTQTQPSLRTETGQFTMADGAAAVSASMELRDVPVYAPWGIAYVPPRGSEVLLLPIGEDIACVGARLQETEGLAPGEVCLYSGGTRLVLKNNGELLLGSVRVTADGKLIASDFIKEDSHGDQV